MSFLTELESMKEAAVMIPEEIIAAMNAGDVRARVRFIFSMWSARIDAANRHPKAPSPIEIRRMELQAAEEIMKEIARG